MSTKQSKNVNNALFIIIILTIYYMLCVAIFVVFTIGVNHGNKNNDHYNYSSFKKILEPSHPKLTLGLEWGEYFLDTIDSIQKGREHTTG